MIVIINSSQFLTMLVVIKLFLSLSKLKNFLVRFYIIVIFFCEIVTLFHFCKVKKVSNENAFHKLISVISIYDVIVSAYSSIRAM